MGFNDPWWQVNVKKLFFRFDRISLYWISFSSASRIGFQAGRGSFLQCAWQPKHRLKRRSKRTKANADLDQNDFLFIQRRIPRHSWTSTALPPPPPQGPSLTLFLIKKDQIFYAICSFAPKTRSIQSIHSIWPFDFCKYHFVEPIHSIVLICQYDCQCQTCLSLKLVNHFDRRQSDVIIQQIDVDAAPALEIEKLAEEARSKSRFIGLELRSN